MYMSYNAGDFKKIYRADHSAISIKRLVWENTLKSFSNLFTTLSKSCKVSVFVKLYKKPSMSKIQAEM